MCGTHLDGIQNGLENALEFRVGCALWIWQIVLVLGTLLELLAFCG